MHYIFLRDFEILLVFSCSESDLEIFSKYICNFSYTGPRSNLLSAFYYYLNNSGFKYITYVPYVVQNLDINCNFEEVTCDPEYDF